MASTDLPATLVQQIASNVLSVAAAAIPLEVVEHTKALIVDSIGCALAATKEAGQLSLTPKCNYGIDRPTAA